VTQRVKDQYAAIEKDMRKIQKGLQEPAGQTRQGLEKKNA
jgi:hypothetical protein